MTIVGTSNFAAEGRKAHLASGSTVTEPFADPARDLGLATPT